MFYNDFFLSDLCVRARFGDKKVANQIPYILDVLGFVREKSTPSSTIVDIEFTRYKNSVDIPSQSLHICTLGNLNFFHDGYYLYVTEGKSSLGVNLNTKSILSKLHDSFWQNPLILQFPLISVGFLVLFWQFNFHELHAACLAKDGKGLLLVGPTGSAKSTLALTLVKAGWNYLSDDMVVIRQTSRELEALTLRRVFKVSQKLITNHPELTHIAKNPLYSFNGDIYVYIDEVYGSQFTQMCIPRMVIFPRITLQEESQIKPLKISEAFISLIENGGYYIGLDNMIMRKRVEIMKEFLNQTECYQMSVGLDIYNDPLKLLEILPEFN